MSLHPPATKMKREAEQQNADTLGDLDNGRTPESSAGSMARELVCHSHEVDNTQSLSNKTGQASSELLTDSSPIINMEETEERINNTPAILPYDLATTSVALGRFVHLLPPAFSNSWVGK